MFGSVASVITSSPLAATEIGREVVAEDNRLLRGTALKQRIEILRARHDGDDAEDAGGGKAVADRQGHVFGAGSTTARRTSFTSVRMA